jgi:hypothetical protein
MPDQILLCVFNAPTPRYLRAGILACLHGCRKRIPWPIDVARALSYRAEFPPAKPCLRQLAGLRSNPQTERSACRTLICLRFLSPQTSFFRNALIHTLVGLDENAVASETLRTSHIVRVSDERNPEHVAVDLINVL